MLKEQTISTAQASKRFLKNNSQFSNDRKWYQSRDILSQGSKIFCDVLFKTKVFPNHFKDWNRYENFFVSLVNC